MINEGNSLPHEPYKEEIITINETIPLGNNVLPYPYYDSDKQNENMSFNSSENDNGQVIINGKSDVTELYYCTKPDENNEGLLNHIFQDKETYSISEVPIGYKIIEKTKPKNTKVDVSGLWELISTNEDGAKNYFYTSYDNIKYKLGPIGGIGAHRTHDGCYNAELLKSTGVK